MSWFSKSPFDEPRRIVGKQHFVVMDGECVDTVEDYLPVIREIAEITGGALCFTHITCEEDDETEDDPDLTRLVTLEQGSRMWTTRLQGYTDWVDEERLLEVLNRALADLGATKRLHSIHHGSWGQELGVVFAGEPELERLRAASYLIESDEPPKPPDDEILAADRVIHGYPFHAGTHVEYWRDPPFDEMQVTLASPHEIAGLALPAGAEILFREEGAIRCTVFDGKRIPFENGAWQLDQAEDGY